MGTTIVALCWEKTYTLGDLIGISFGWSFASGALISLPPLGIANLTKEPSEYGRRIGLGYTVAAFGALLGNPIAGAVLGAPPHPYNVPAVQRQFRGVWFVAGGAAAIATILLLAVRCRLVGMNLFKKV